MGGFCIGAGDILGNEKFAVECEFRSSLYNEKLCWTTWEKLREYNRFAEENGIPTFIVIGLEGEPDYPRYMICMPLNEARYPELYPSVFENYMRNPGKKFFWKNGRLS